MKRKVYLFLATILCFFTLTACGSKTEAADTGYDETVVEQVAREAVDEWSGQVTSEMDRVSTDDEAAKYKQEILDTYEAMGMTVSEEQEKGIDEMIDVLRGWYSVQKEVGEFVSLKDKKAEFSDAEDAKFVNVKLEAECEKGRMYVTVPVLRKASLDDQQQIQYDMMGLKLEEIKTLGQKMSKAGLNTLMGVGLVFVLLIVICLLISTFGIFGKIGKKKEEPKKEAAAPAPVAAAAPAPAAEEELVDDTELVAVITAAIMASMGDEAPADGLVVRSIRRRR